MSSRSQKNFPPNREWRERHGPARASEAYFTSLVCHSETHTDSLSLSLSVHCGRQRSCRAATSRVCLPGGCQHPYIDIYSRNTRAGRDDAHGNTAQSQGCSRPGARRLQVPRGPRRSRRFPPRDPRSPQYPPSSGGLPRPLLLYGRTPAPRALLQAEVSCGRLGASPCAAGGDSVRRMCPRRGRSRSRAVAGRVCP